MSIATLDMSVISRMLGDQRMREFIPRNLRTPKASCCGRDPIVDVPAIKRALYILPDSRIAELKSMLGCNTLQFYFHEMGRLTSNAR